MPTDFVFERETDFLEAANMVEPKYLTVDGLLMRAFFKSGWWLCVYEIKATDEEALKASKEKYMTKGFIPIAIRESPIRLF